MKTLNNYINESLIKKDTKLKTDFLSVKDIFEYCKIYWELEDKEEPFQGEFKKAIEKWANDFDVKLVSYPIVFGDSKDAVNKIKEVYKDLNLDLEKVTFNSNSNNLYNKYYGNTTKYFDGLDLDMDPIEYPLLEGSDNSLNMSCNIITKKYVETAVIIFEKK